MNLMHFLQKRLRPLLTVGVLAALIGCGLISGTFVLTIMLIEDDDFSWFGDFYYAEVDLTEDDVWEDHGDDIQNIDLFGFELWIRNNGAANKYQAYIARMSSTLDAGSSREDVENDAIQVLEDIPVPANSSFISYAESFKYLRNEDSLKAMAESGQFKLFAYADFGDTTNVHIDSLRIVATITAGK